MTLTGTGAYEGVSCEVDSIDSQPVQFLVLARVEAFAAAGGAESILALQDLYETFAAFARPYWNLTGPKGPVPTTQAGMATVPVPLMILLISLWTETFDAG